MGECGCEKVVSVGQREEGREGVAVAVAVCEVVWLRLELQMDEIWWRLPPSGSELHSPHFSVCATVALICPNTSMPKPLVDLTAVCLLSVILAMVWRYHWRSMVDGDEIGILHALRRNKLTKTKKIHSIHF
jgi:hypothetical protein